MIIYAFIEPVIAKQKKYEKKTSFRFVQVIKVKFKEAQKSKKRHAVFKSPEKSEI